MKEVCKITAVFEIPSVRVHILTEEDNFAKSLLPQSLDFIYNLLEPAAPFPSAHVWDNTVGAEVVAPIDNGNPG
jgi:hypothetical protein